MTSGRSRVARRCRRDGYGCGASGCREIARGNDHGSAFSLDPVGLEVVRGS